MSVGISTNLGSCLVKLFNKFQWEVEQKLPFEHLLDEEAAIILLTFDQVMRTHHLRWLYRAWQSCRDERARAVCHGLLNTEIATNLPCTLYNLVCKLDTQYGYLDEKVTAAVNNCQDAIRDLSISSLYSPGGVLVVTALEQASLAYIPRLKNWARKLQLPTVAYFQKRSAGDTHRICDLIEIVCAEAALGINSKNALGIEEEVKLVLPRVGDLVRLIFTATVF